jgi:dolichol-phosphate mannosyltransferase
MRNPSNEPGSVKIDLILPAHNEGRRIEKTIREFYQVVAVEGGLDLRLLISEDGSSDDTAGIITSLSHELPVTLLHTAYPRGYSRAVVDGLRASTAPLVAACDSDGQYDPANLLDLVNALGDHDVAVGYRNPRQDPVIRKVMSASFKLAYELVQPGRFRDPSCPFVLYTRNALTELVLKNPRVPFMPQGLWWEMSARTAGLKIDVIEVPIHHRRRDEGGSVVYRPRRIPRIVADNMFGLWLAKGDIAFQVAQRQQ